MKAIIKEVGLPARIENIEGNLDCLQKLVGGYIECVYDLDEHNISIWCNEEVDTPHS